MKVTASSTAGPRSSRHSGSSIAPLRPLNHSMREDSPISLQYKKRPHLLQSRVIPTPTPTPTPFVPHSKTVYHSDCETLVETPYGPCDWWEEEVYKVEEEVDTDDDVAQIERARRMRDRSVESDSETLRRRMHRMEIGAEDSDRGGEEEKEGEREGERLDPVPRARERAQALLADTGLCSLNIDISRSLLFDLFSRSHTASHSTVLMHIYVYSSIPSCPSLHFASSD